MNRKVFVLTAVCLLLLALLAACAGGTSEEVESTQDEGTEAEEETAGGFEATGSESDGKGILPTPITGAKVATTRKGSRQFDLYFLVQPSLSDAIHLEAVPDWLVAQSVPIETQFALGFLNDTFADEVAFTSDFEAMLALLSQPPNVNNQTQPPDDLLNQMMALAAWRVGAEHLLFVFIEDDAVELNAEDLEAIVETAVSNSTAVYPLLSGNFSAEDQLLWQQLADETNGRLSQMPDSTLSVAAWEQILMASLDHALAN